MVVYSVYSIHIILSTNTATVKWSSVGAGARSASSAGMRLRDAVVCGIQKLTYNVRKLEGAVTMSHLPAGVREYPEAEDV